MSLCQKPNQYRHPTPKIPPNHAFFHSAEAFGLLQRLLWVPEVGLFAATSRGSLYRLDWPHTIADAAAAAADAVEPISAQLLRLHRGPADPCFSMLACTPPRAFSARRLLSLGRGYLHPLQPCLSSLDTASHHQTAPSQSRLKKGPIDLSTPSASSSYCLISLFCDEQFCEPFAL